MKTTPSTTILLLRSIWLSLLSLHLFHCSAFTTTTTCNTMQSRFHLQYSSTTDNNNNDEPSQSSSNDLERYRNRSQLLESTLRHKVQALQLSDQKLHVLQDAVKRLVQKQQHEKQQRHSSNTNNTVPRKDYEKQQKQLKKLQSTLEKSAREHAKKEALWQEQHQKFEQTIATLRRDHANDLEQERCNSQRQWQQQHDHERQESIAIAQAAVEAAERRAHAVEHTWQERYKKEHATFTTTLEWQQKWQDATKKVATLEKQLVEVVKDSAVEESQHVDLEQNDNNDNKSRSFAPIIPPVANEEAKIEKEELLDLDQKSKIQNDEDVDRTLITPVNGPSKSELDRKDIKDRSFPTFSSPEASVVDDSVVDDSVDSSEELDQEQRLGSSNKNDDTSEDLPSLITSPPVVEVVPAQENVATKQSQRRPGRVRRLASRLLRPGGVGNVLRRDSSRRRHKP